jgi:SAM-dependent methyltransferase
MGTDRITELYQGDIGVRSTQLRARERIHWMCERVRGDDVLDVGCSQGIATLLLAREGRRVTGVDVDEGALDFARAALEREDEVVRGRVEFVKADAGELPFDTDSRDTVILGEVLEHLVDPSRVLTETERVVRPGGTVVITVPYGVFRSDDHKEPIYITALVDAVPDGLTPVEFALIDRYLGVVLTAGEPRDEEGAFWRQATLAAEDRVRVLDRRIEEVEAASNRERSVHKSSRERDLVERTELELELKRTRNELRIWRGRAESRDRQLEALRRTPAVRLAARLRGARARVRRKPTTGAR